MAGLLGATVVGLTGLCRFHGRVSVATAAASLRRGKGPKAHCEDPRTRGTHPAWRRTLYKGAHLIGVVTWGPPPAHRRGGAFFLRIARPALGSLAEAVLRVAGTSLPGAEFVV